LGRYGGKSPATVAKFFQKIIGTYRICQRLTPNQHTREGHGSIPNNRYIQIHTTETSMISPPPPYERKESNKKIKAQQSKAQSRGAVRRPPSTRSLAGTPRFAAIRPAARHQGSRDVAEGAMSAAAAAPGRSAGWEWTARRRRCSCRGTDAGEGGRRGGGGGREDYDSSFSVSLPSSSASHPV